jgi:hypothetical protein
MAIFSVFITSLYSSNLINFFYYQSFPGALDTSSASIIGIHPAYKNIISYEDLGVYKGSGRNLTSLYMMPYGMYPSDTLPVVPNTWGGDIKNSTTRLNLIGYYKSVYQVVYPNSVPQHVISYINTYINKRVSDHESVYSISTDRDLVGKTYFPEPQLNLQDTWGIFVILCVGYILSLIFRVVFTKKTGLDKLVFFRREDVMAVFMPGQTDLDVASSLEKYTFEPGNKSSAKKDTSSNRSPGFMEVSLN